MVAQRLVAIDNEEAKSHVVVCFGIRANKIRVLKIDLWTKDMPVDEMKIFLSSKHWISLLTPL